MAEDCSWKNRLQEFVLRASFPHPTYKSTKEGSQHAPRFRSEVSIDGFRFLSRHTHPNKKMSEQDAAKHALIGILEKVKSDVASHLLQNTAICKSILHEYASKMKLDLPTYETDMLTAPIPLFVSSLILNGLKFSGESAKNKKEAEQLAARSAILSTLHSDLHTTMAEMAFSKLKWASKAINGGNDITGTSIANPYPYEAIQELGGEQHCNSEALFSRSTQVAQPQNLTAELPCLVIDVTPASGKKRKRENENAEAILTAETTTLQNPIGAVVRS